MYSTSVYGLETLVLEGTGGRALASDHRARGICTPDDRLDRFSRYNAQVTNWIAVTKKMAHNLNYFSDDEESKWLANIDPSLLEKSNEEKQLDDGEIHHL